MADPVDIKVLIPRVRRAVEGVGKPEVLTDDNIRDLIADAIANVILYSGGLFGHELLVTATDGTTGYPQEYATDTALTFAEQSVIASQAALDFFLVDLVTAKTSEKISDEAQTWEYTTSAQAIRDRIKQLITQRDKALDTLQESHALETYSSFVAVRDQHVSQLIEPWVYPGLPSGQEVPW